MSLGRFQPSGDVSLRGVRRLSEHSQPARKEPSAKENEMIRKPLGRLLSTVVPVALLAGAAVPAAAQTWTAQSSGTAQILEGVWFTSDLDGWIVGNAGTARFTNDGGMSWTAVALTGGDLGDVAFRSAAVGLIVGDNGAIFRTVNGGLNWTPVASGTGENLLNVAFGGPGLAYASGRDGVILRSADDGASWTVAESGTGDRYRDISAVGLTAWTVGDGGVIRATADGGASWFSPASGTGSDLHGVQLLSESEGWIVGQNSTVLYTNDAGASFSSRSSPILVGLNTVFFVSPTLGWVAGNNGAIFTTVNAGLTWTPEASGTANALNKLFFTSAAKGWLVGDGGTLLMRDDPTGVGDLAGVGPGAPSAELLGNAPNPFGPSTSITYSVPAGREGRVTLAVYDTAGRVVRTLVDSVEPAGTHVAAWDGRDRSGARAASGVYFYRLSFASGSRAGRMVLMR